jgi:hypothetical protein
VSFLRHCVWQVAGVRQDEFVKDEAETWLASFSGFGSSADFSANALIPANAPTVVAHRPILLGATALSPNEPGTTPNDNVPVTIAGANGAFTMEATLPMATADSTDVPPNFMTIISRAAPPSTSARR